MTQYFNFDVHFYLFLAGVKFMNFYLLKGQKVEFIEYVGGQEDGFNPILTDLLFFSFQADVVSDGDASIPTHSPAL